GQHRHFGCPQGVQSPFDRGGITERSRPGSHGSQPERTKPHATLVGYTHSIHGFSIRTRSGTRRLHTPTILALSGGWMLPEVVTTTSTQFMCLYFSAADGSEAFFLPSRISVIAPNQVFAGVSAPNMSP